MSWENFDLSTVNPNNEILPEGDYTFKLSGAKYAANSPGRIEANATVATEGDFTGRKVFFSYPDPSGFDAKGKSMDWSAKALKRLEIALGVDATPGQDPVEYLNGAAVAGGTFAAPVVHKTSDEYPTKAEVVIFKVRPAA